MSEDCRKATEPYSPDPIRQSEGIEGIRLRPAMYVGGTDAPGLHHLAWEIIDNSFDEYENGNATSIQVRLHADGLEEYFREYSDVANRITQAPVAQSHS